MFVMASTYFSSIIKNLGNVRKHDDNQAKLLLYDLDLPILKMFCSCLEACHNYTTDEQGNESLRCMMHQLKLIWVEEQDNMNLAENTWPEDLQDFHPLTFGLERKIQQSKQLIEQWCQILVRSSSMQMEMMQMEMQSKSSTSSDIFINVYGLLKYRAAEIVPFKKQIEILKHMLAFLSKSVTRIRECIDSKELLEYINFVHVFSNNAAWLTCMYWAKEANEEAATEMNTVLFDTLHKIKPCAARVTACYFAILKSNSLLQSDDSCFEGETVASFVDFFFEHTILIDDFLIVREWLIVLFTFIADAPQENAEEEDLIRTQIYTLFCEDAYLLLPISEMKEDFSIKKMLLSDFINKIEVLSANIIHLYCGSKNSWTILEAEKMNYIFFAPLHRELSSLKYVLSKREQARVDPYLTEIKFLRFFFQCFETFDDSGEETRARLSSIVKSFQMIWGQNYDMSLFLGRIYAMSKGDIIVDWRHLNLELKEKFHMSKQEISAWLVSLAPCSFHCKPSTNSKILKFLDSVFYCLSDLITYRTAFKKQTEILKEKLLLLKNLLKLTTNCPDSKNLDKFNLLAHVFANSAAFLIYLLWANDEIPPETNLMLSDMLKRIKPDTPVVARMYIGTLKDICLQPYDCLLFEETVMSFVDFFFEDLATPWKNDFQILREELLFHLTFVHHHHIGNAEEITSTQLDVLFSDSVYDLPFDDLKGDLSNKVVGLSDFIMKIRAENVKIRHIYCQLTDSVLSKFPRIIGQGFLDCLIQKLRNLTERMISDQKYVPFAKYKIMKTEEGLISLTSIFDQILEMKDLNDTWLEVVNVVYLAEHVISLCFMFYHLINHYIIYLSDVVDRIEVVKTKFKKIEDFNMYNSRCLPHSDGLMNTLLEQDGTSDEMVGFEVDVKILTDNLTRGTKSLDIVSIVGMGGLGKTTLAKKVYRSSSIKSYFNVFAFSSVTQHHNKRMILLDILKDIIGVDDKTSRMTEDDMAHKLKKCLSRQKYFIVLDDIWSINAWDEVRSSFPDDRNGSRVMFTTRYLDVAKKGQIKCSPHLLRFLTEDESWKLLQKKVFHSDTPPQNLTKVAKLIAKRCGGLPLAIVVIAGLLARTERSIWTEISERVSSHILDEGCMNTLELSYKHLPEYLKPCLLYLGAFPEDTTYRVRSVTLLWIDEGLIKESKTKSLNDVAKEYLYELISRSLVIVDEMTTGEDIRTFRVHDLIHDFCIKKCQDNTFFRLGCGTVASCFSNPSICKDYRVSVHKPCDVISDVEPSLANTRSLLYFPSKFDYSQQIFPLRMFRFAQVLHLRGKQLQKSDFAQVTSLIDLRHIEAEVDFGALSIPSSISNLWNMQSLILRNVYYGIDLPETLWRMKSLRHVKVRDCTLKVSDGYKLHSYPQLDKVVSFSSPRLSTGKEVEWLLQRLPAVRRLGCILDYKSVDSAEERVETFDFHRKLESLKLELPKWGRNCPYSINFPPTLIKLTLAGFKLPLTAISAIAELQYLRILKLRDVSFPGPTWEMEDLTFPNLKYLELRRSILVLWNADIDAFPCLEHLYFYRIALEELPICFGESSSLKKITILYSPKLKSSALLVQEEQMDLGNNVELVVSK